MSTFQSEKQGEAHGCEREGGKGKPADAKAGESVQEKITFANSESGNWPFKSLLPHTFQSSGSLTCAGFGCSLRGAA